MIKTKQPSPQLTRTQLALAVSLVCSAAFGGYAAAQSLPVAALAVSEGAAPDATPAGEIAPVASVEIASRKTRSSVALARSDMQKILPGINPLKALQTLPGVREFPDRRPVG